MTERVGHAGAALAVMLALCASTALGETKRRSPADDIFLTTGRSALPSIQR